MLRNKISLHFKEAISVSDLESVKRFFKLFPLLNMHDYGLETFSSLLRKMVRFLRLLIRNYHYSINRIFFFQLN